MNRKHEHATAGYGDHHPSALAEEAVFVVFGVHEIGAPSDFACVRSTKSTAFRQMMRQSSSAATRRLTAGASCLRISDGSASQLRIFSPKSRPSNLAKR